MPAIAWSVRSPCSRILIWAMPLGTGGQSRFVHQELGPAADDGQQVVEVVGDAAAMRPRASIFAPDATAVRVLSVEELVDHRAQPERRSSRDGWAEDLRDETLDDAEDVLPGRDREAIAPCRSARRAASWAGKSVSEYLGRTRRCRFSTRVRGQAGVLCQ